MSIQECIIFCFGYHNIKKWAELSKLKDNEGWYLIILVENIQMQICIYNMLVLIWIIIYTYIYTVHTYSNGNLMHYLIGSSLLSPPATRCMWRRSPLSWKKTVDQYPYWLVSHTACHCRVTSATWRRIFPPRSWSRKDPQQTRGTGLTQINPRALLPVWRGKDSNSTLKRKERREKKRECFFFLFVSKKIQATKDDIEKLKTGLDEFCYFQTQKQDCGALLYLHVLLSQHLAQRCNTT